MRKILWLASALVVLALLAVEAAIFAGPRSPVRPVAGLLWLAISVAVLLSAGVASLLPFFRRDFWSLPHRTWYFLAFFGLPFLVLFGTSGITFVAVDTEGLGQLRDGVHLLRTDAAFGVFSMGYARYVARQFLLNSLPTLLCGPSLLAARFGNSMFYLVGYAVFLSALLAHLRRRKSADPLLFAAYGGVLIAFGQYALLNARKFEQSTMPLGCILFFLGALLYFVDEPGPLDFLWVTWSVGFFTGCYTPALAGWALAMAVLGYLVLWRRSWLLLPAVLYGFACLGVAYLIMQRVDPGALSAEFGAGPEHRLSTAGWIHRILLGIRATLGSDFSLIQAPEALAILAGILLAWRQRDWRYGAVCLWGLAVSVLSVIVIGSFFGAPNRVLERGLVILPPLVLGAVLLLDRHLSAAPGKPLERTPRLIMKASIGYLAFTGVFTVLLVPSFFGPQTESDDDEVFYLAGQLAATPGARPREFYMVPPLAVDLGVGMPYFAPDAHWWVGPPPAGHRAPGSYVFSYLHPDPADRNDIDPRPGAFTRPFVTLKPE